MTKNRFAYILALIGLIFLVQPSIAAITDWGDQQWYHWSDADFNSDFVVDANDLAELAIDWLTSGYTSDRYGPGTDINKDGTVNLLDFLLYAGEFGRNAADEFGFGHGKIVVGINKGYDLQAAAPEIGAKITVKNVSTGVSSNYEIDMITTDVGLYQGIDVITQLDMQWSLDYSTNFNRIIQWTDSPYYFDRVRVGTQKVFILYAEGSIGQDPNDLYFEGKIVEAETSAGFYCNTVNAPMPHSKN